MESSYRLKRQQSWGQFHKHAYAKLLQVQMLWRLTSISPTILGPTLPVNSTRCYAQLLHTMLYDLCQKDERKSTGTKAAHRRLMKLTPSLKIHENGGGGDNFRKFSSNLF